MIIKRNYGKSAASPLPAEYLRLQEAAVVFACSGSSPPSVHLPSFPLGATLPPLPAWIGVEGLVQGEPCYPGQLAFSIPCAG